MDQQVKVLHLHLNQPAPFGSRLGVALDPLLSKSYARMTRPTSCATVAMDISYAVNVKSYEVIMLGFMFYVY